MSRRRFIMAKMTTRKTGGLLFFVCLLLAACFVATPMLSLADNLNQQLTSGVSVHSTLSATGTKDNFYIAVPSGCTALEVKTLNPTGTNDFDLYVKKGSAPTTSSYDVRGYTSSSAETCTISSPAAATYYIMVYSYSGSGGYDVKATYTGGSTITTLTLGTEGSGSLSAAGQSNQFSVVVGSGYTSLTVKTYNPTGTNDFDLYVKRGSMPTTSSYDARAYTSSSTETCTISNPVAGTFYIMVYDYSGSGTYKIMATASGGGDTTAPTISSVASSSITTSGATITWTTNEASSSVVEYGTTTSYGSSVTGTNSVTSHSVALTGLSASTTYHYRVKSADAAGNTATSSDYTFTTASAGDTTPPTISSVTAGSITSSGATITWTTNEASTSVVEYGTTTSYGSSATGSSGVTSHTVTLSSLTASTTYHYRVKSADTAGNTATSSDYSFTTSASGSSTVVLTLNVTSSSYSFTAAGQSKYFQVTMGSGFTSLVVFMDGPSSGADFDLYVKKGSQPTTSSYDVRGYTSYADETCTVSSPAAATYYIMAYCYSGTGSYTMKASGTFGSTDTTPPTISSVASGSITSSGATITWTTNEASTSVVEYGTTTSYGSTSTGTSGVTSHSVALTGLLASTIYHYRVKSADTAGNTATSTDYTFTTSGSTTVTALTDGTAKSDSLGATGDKDYFSIVVGTGKATLKVELTGASGTDFDLYVKSGATPTTSSYDVKSATTGSSTETCTINNPSAATYYIMVYSYSGSGTYTIKATTTTSSGGGNKWALVVGISNYQSINDLSYCDEDANDWTSYLQGKGYTVKTLIDSAASQSAIYNAIDTWLLPNEVAGDYVAICFSGHGGYQSEGGYSSSAGTQYAGQTDGHPSQYFAWDADGSGNGCILDNVLTYHLLNLQSTHVLIFFDSCRSGGMDEVAGSSSSGRYVSETCGWDEYGYDAPSHNNGAWTYWFLEWAIQSQGYTVCETAYTNATPKYHAEYSDSNPEQQDNYSGSFSL